MHMKKFYRLIYSCIFLALGYSFLSDYFSADLDKQQQQRIQALEQLVQSPQTITARLDSVISERIIRVSGVDTYFYETKYFYSVDGKQYEGVYKPKSRPTQKQLAIQYLPTNPEISSANASEELALLEEEKESSFKLWAGLALALAGGLGVWSFISKFLQKRKQEQEDEEHRMAEERERVQNLLSRKG